jgi:DNA-binding MarR family transcriptional regulator
MNVQTRESACCNKAGKFGGNKPLTVDGSGMPPREREDALLRFLDSHGIPLPPKAIYRGMKIQEDITFAYRTVQEMLKRLNEEGYVMRCDKEALDDGRIEPVPEDKSGRRTYYFITEKGRKRIRPDSE